MERRELPGPQAHIAGWWREPGLLAPCLVLYPLTHTAWPSNRPKGTRGPVYVKQRTPVQEMVGFGLFRYFNESTGGQCLFGVQGINVTRLLSKYSVGLRQARNTKRTSVLKSKGIWQKARHKVNAVSWTTVCYSPGPSGKPWQKRKSNCHLLSAFASGVTPPGLHTPLS